MFTVRCSWERVRGADFESLVTFTEDPEKENTVSDPLEFVSMESAGQFAQPAGWPLGHHHQSCYIRLESAATHSVSNIRLTSEAPKIEVFTGNEAEYLDVQFGELLDRLDDISVFMYEFELPTGTDKIALKFFPESTHFWIIGFHLQLTPRRHRPNQSSINMQNVQAKLDSSAVSLSDSAEKCKRFLSMHMNSGSGPMQGQGPPKFADLLAYVKHSEKNTPDLPNGYSLDTAEVDDSEESMPNNEGAADPNRSSAIPAPAFGDAGLMMLKSYFDTQLKELEVRISIGLDTKLRAMEVRQNRRFDAILEKLRRNECKSTEEATDQLELD